MAKDINKQAEYNADQITVLEGLDPVRKRPGMYIGGTGEEGLHHLIWEIVDNAIDEAIQGHCDTIDVTINPDNSVDVFDNGRGIPVDIHKKTKTSALETIMTTLHAGGKFDNQAYKISGGLHGVGASVVNALSEWTKVEVHKDGKIHSQEYKRGIPKSKIKVIGTTKRRGTKVSFKADSQIFNVTEYKRSIIMNTLRKSAYLTRNIRINFSDYRDSENKFDYSFYFEGGLASYVQHLNITKEKKNNTVFFVSKEQNDCLVEIALQYTSEYQENILTFANHKINPGGGTHLSGFKTALTRSLNSYARKNNALKEKDENLTGEDTREGLTAIISVNIPDPQFEGQTKDKLGNPEVKSIVDSVFSEGFTYFLEENPKDAEQILDKCFLASRARKAARVARDSVLRKGALDSINFPGKLADCSSRVMEQCELYIVEGDSAGGTAKQGRDRKFQAILPMRGKLLNVEKARIDRIFSSDKLKPLISALGTGIGEIFDISKLRYDRIILMADADVDGSHIRTLLLTFFFRHFKPLIEQGHLYVAQPPLYKISKGKESFYAFDDEEKDSILEQIKQKALAKNKKAKELSLTKTDKEDIKEETSGSTSLTIDGVGKIDLQRYKGLGEMNPIQLWETTMDPAQRVMRKITIENAEAAEKTFRVLMGSDVASRKRFIQTRAKEVNNIDI